MTIEPDVPAELLSKAQAYTNTAASQSAATPEKAGTERVLLTQTTRLSGTTNAR